MEAGPAAAVAATKLLFKQRELRERLHFDRAEGDGDAFVPYYDTLKESIYLNYK